MCELRAVSGVSGDVTATGAVSVGTERCTSIGCFAVKVSRTVPVRSGLFFGERFAFKYVSVERTWRRVYQLFKYSRQALTLLIAEQP